MRPYKPSDTEYERMREKALSDLVTECMAGEKIGRGRRETWLAEILETRMEEEDDLRAIVSGIGALIANRENTGELVQAVEQIVSDWCERNELVEQRVQDMMADEEAVAADYEYDRRRDERMA